MNKQASVAVIGSNSLNQNQSQSIISHDELAQKTEKQQTKIMQLAASRATLNVLNNDAKLEGEIARLEARIDYLEQKQVKTIQQPAQDSTNNIDQKFQVIGEEIENQVLEKVAELLTNNIYDLIPGYAELEEKVDAQFQEIESVQEQLLQFKDNISEHEMINNRVQEEIQVLKSKFSTQFMQKIEKAINNIQTLQYDLEMVKMNSQQFALKKDIDSLENRMGSFVQRNDFDKVRFKLEKMAERVCVERLEEEVTRLDKEFAHYAQVRYVDQTVQDLRINHQKQIDTKLERVLFDSKIEELQLGLTAAELRIQDNYDQQKATNTNLKYILDQAKVSIAEIERELLTKMSTVEGADIWANFSKFAVYDDLKDLYTRCVPAISAQEDKLKKIRDENAKMQEIMRNFDGLICEKASKEGLKNLTTFCNATFILKVENDQFKMEQQTKMKEYEDKINYMNDMVITSQKNANKEMYSAIRKVVGQWQNKQEEGKVDYHEVTDQFREILKDKVNKEAVIELKHNKAAKIDVELCMRWIDLLHRMIKSLIQMQSMKLKLDIDETGHETQNQKQNKKVEIFHQSLIVQKWIESFNSQDVNDFFSVSQKEGFPVIAQSLDKQYRTVMDAKNNMTLSPNLKTLNLQVQANRQKLGKSEIKTHSPKKNFGLRSTSLAFQTPSKTSVFGQELSPSRTVKQLKFQNKLFNVDSEAQHINVDSKKEFNLPDIQPFYQKI